MRISYRNVVTNFLVLAFFAVFVSGCAGIYNDLVLDNADHNIPCEELPSVAEVEQNLKEQDAIVQAILAIDPEQTFVDIDTEQCPGHADIVISYASHESRTKIEQFLEANPAFDIPYRLRNR